MHLAFYQLRTEPFQLTPDPRFLHLAKTHRDALTGLIHGVAQRRGFVVLTGPIGTGKTTIVRATLQLLTDQLFTKTPLASAFIVNPTLTREEFLEFLLEEFEIPCPSTSKPRRLMALHKMLLATHGRGGTSVLIVDEAHLLSAEVLEEIRLLGNADTDREKLLQVVLSGQPELLTVLARPELQALRQRVAGWCNLRPLDMSETSVYIAERLHVAGLQGASPFLPAALHQIHALSNGVPRLINLLCGQCLLDGFSLQRHTIDAEIVDNAAVELALTPSPDIEIVPQPKPVLSPDNSIMSSMDVLIAAMKQGRTAVRG